VRSCRLTATAPDGSTHTTQLSWTLDDIARGLSDDEIDAKFHALNRDFMPTRQREELVRMVRHCDDGSTRVRALVDQLFI